MCPDFRCVMGGGGGGKEGNGGLEHKGCGLRIKTVTNRKGLELLQLWHGGKCRHTMIHY